MTPSAGAFDRNRASDDRAPPSLIGRNYRSQGCPANTIRQVIKATIARLNVETVSVGIQNKNILRSLFSSRLAAKNNAKNARARIQNSGERIHATCPPVIAASPVAFDPLMPRTTDQEPGTGSALKVATSPLRIPFT